MDLDPTDGQLPSRRIADVVRTLINDGELAPGDKLPSERELARRFGTARNTAREAIRLLSEEGLVTAQHGRGVFVREKQRLLRRDNERYSRRTYHETGLTPFRWEMASQDQTPRVKVTSIEQVIPPFDIADRLKTSPDEPSVLRRCNTYYADDDPLQVVTTYIRWADAEATPLLQPKTGPGGIYGRLEERGHTMTSGQDEIVARMARRDEAQILDLPPGVPVLEVLHTSFNQDGEPFEVSRFVHRADRTGLVYRFPVEG